MNGKSLLGMIFLACLAFAMIFVGVYAWTQETPSPRARPTPAPKAVIAAKAPEDIIPLTVPSFNFVEKSDRVNPMFEGEEYSASSFFVPKPNSKFQNKVDHLTVDVHLFKDEASSQQHFNFIAGFGTSSIEIQVNGEPTILTYNERVGETIAIQQQGRLVIYSLSAPPFEAVTFDEEVLKDAAIEGFKAIRF